MTINGSAINEEQAADEEAYQLWVRDSSAACINLVELDYVGTGGAIFTLKLSDKPFPPYYDVVKTIPSFSRQLSERGTGRTTVSIGNLVLDNHDGSLDTWLRLSIDGQKVRIRHGDPSWEAARFRLTAVCIAEIVESATREEISIRLRGLDHAANLPFWTTPLMGGTGPNANKIMPIALGQVFNIEPKLLDASAGLYVWHAAPLHAVTAVRDSGIDFQTSAKTVSAVDTGTETITFSTTHGFFARTRVQFAGTPPAPLIAGTDYWVIAAGLTTVDARFSAVMDGSAINLTGSTTGATAIGYHWTNVPDGTGGLVLASALAGQLTIDAQGAMHSGYHDDAASMIVLILDETDVDAVSKAAFLAAYSQPTGINLAERTNRLDAADQIATGISAWYGYSRAGMLQFGRLALSPGYQGLDIGPDDMKLAGLKLEKLLIPEKDHRVGYAKNWTVQSSGLAAGVSDENKALYGGKGSVAVSVAAPPSYAPHALATVPPLIESMLVDTNAAATEADRLDNLYADYCAIFSCEVGRIGYLADIGKTVKVTHSRFELVSGVNMICVGIEDKPSDGAVMLKLFTPLANYAPGQL